MTNNNNIFPALSPDIVPEQSVPRQQIAARPFFDPVRRGIAKHSRLPDYADYCDTHGVTLFSTSTGLCLACSRPRAVARREGRTTYVAPCDTHGPVAHAVTHGRCLICYTTAGTLRSDAAPGRPPISAARAQARREGRARYVAPCATHGEVEHNTARGQCLSCFTTLGKPRVDAKVTVCQLRDMAHALEREQGPHWATRRDLLLTAADALERRK